MPNALSLCSLCFKVLATSGYSSKCLSILNHIIYKIHSSCLEHHCVGTAPKQPLETPRLEPKRMNGFCLQNYLGRKFLCTVLTSFNLETIMTVTPLNCLIASKCELLKYIHYYLGFFLKMVSESSSNKQFSIKF